MSSVNTIIELGYGLDEDEQIKIKKLFELIFNMQDKEIKIYDAFNYSNNSDFAQLVYDEIQVKSEKYSGINLRNYYDKTKNLR